MITTDLLVSLVEKAKTDKKGLILLKNTAVRLHQFELATELRQMEGELFPDTKEVADAKSVGDQMINLLAMVGITVTQKVGWIVAQTMNDYEKMRGDFDIKTSAEIVANANKYFGEE